MYFSHQSAVRLWAVFQFSLCKSSQGVPAVLSQVILTKQVMYRKSHQSVFWCLKVLYDIHSMFEACCCFLLSLVCFLCVRMKTKRFSLSRFSVIQLMSRWSSRCSTISSIQTYLVIRADGDSSQVHWMKWQDEGWITCEALQLNSFQLDIERLRRSSLKPSIY